MKYINGKILKSCGDERLRKKILTNAHTGAEYVAYYPAGYEAMEYFNSGSQVNVSTVRQRGTGNIYLLKNTDPTARGFSDALKREIQVSHIVAKSFKSKDAPNVPEMIEGTYFYANPMHSYVIEEKVDGDRLTHELFYDLSHSKQKLVLIEFAKHLKQMHFSIPDKYLKLSHFVIDKPIEQNPVPNYRRQKLIGPLFRHEKLSLVHNDLAPANVLFDGDKLTVIDYGRAGISNKSIDFAHVRQNWSEEFAIRLMDTYIRICKASNRR